MGCSTATSARQQTWALSEGRGQLWSLGSPNDARLGGRKTQPIRRASVSNSVPSWRLSDRNNDSLGGGWINSGAAGTEACSGRCRCAGECGGSCKGACGCSASCRDNGNHPDYRGAVGVPTLSVRRESEADQVTRGSGESTGGERLRERERELSRSEREWPLCDPWCFEAKRRIEACIAHAERAPTEESCRKRFQENCYWHSNVYRAFCPTPIFCPPLKELNCPPSEPLVPAAGATTTFENEGMMVMSTWPGSTP